MTRKHFIVLAKALAATRPNQTTQPRNYKRWLDAVAQLMVMCRSLNPAFSDERFLAACHAPVEGQEDWPTCAIEACARVAEPGRVVCKAHFSFQPLEVAHA